MLACFFHMRGQQPGSADLTFNPQDPGFCQNNGTDGSLETALIEPDGKILVGGTFARVYGGVPGTDYLQRFGIVRFTAAGALDTSFHAEPVSALVSVKCIARQQDGRILVGGLFNEWSPGFSGNMVRLLSNGRLDSSFVAGTGFDDAVREVLVRPNGQIVVVGNFAAYNGVPCGHIVQLNSDGSMDAGFQANLGSGSDGALLALALQADEKLLVGGAMVTFNGTTRTNIVRLNADGTLDTTWDANGVGCDGTVSGIVLNSNGKAVVVGAFNSAMGAAAHGVCRLNTNGALDSGFDAGDGPSGSVYTLAQGPGQTVYVGGLIYAFDDAPCSGIVRLQSDGSRDLSFDTGLGTDAVYEMALQANGKPVIVGFFNSYDGHSRNHIARLQQNGNVDDTFMHSEGIVFGGFVRDIARQPDGKLIIGGSFRGYNDLMVPALMRILPDGEQDNSFALAGLGPSLSIEALALQPDGKVLAGGSFSTFNGAPPARLVRLLSDGTVDSGFAIGSGFSGTVSQVIVQPDGKILCAGGMTALNGTPCTRIIRLLPTGAIDTTFNVGSGPDGSISAMVLQADGRILIGGSFELVDGNLRSCIARLNEDGSLDASFDPGGGCVGSAPSVLAMAQRPDGRIIIGGRFMTYNGVARDGIAGLLNDGSLDLTFDPGVGLNSTSDGVFDLGLETSGRLLVAGSFEHFNGQPRSMIARLLESGALDPDHATGEGEYFVHCLEMLPNDDAMLGGNFHFVQGVGRNALARLKGGFSTVIGEATAASEQLTVIPWDGTPGSWWVRVPDDQVGPVRIEVSDLAGRVVLSHFGVVAADGAYRFDLDASAGVHTVTVTGQGRTRQGRFVQAGR